MQLSTWNIFDITVRIDYSFITFAILTTINSSYTPKLNVKFLSVYDYYLSVFHSIMFAFLEL
jgi:hypothetical protein